MKYALLQLLFLFYFITSSHRCWAAMPSNNKSTIILSIGAAETDWNLIVARCQNDINCTIGINYYVPISAKDMAASFSISWWHQFTPELGIRAEFTQLHPAYITFSQAPTTYEREHIIPFDKNPLTSHTQVTSLFLTITTHLSHSKWRFITSLGLGLTHRKDQLANLYHIGPALGIDLMRQLKNNFMIGMGVEVFTGHATMNLKPVDSYIPFIYALKLNIGWQF